MSIEISKRISLDPVNLSVSVPIEDQPLPRPVQDITSEGCGFQSLINTILAALALLIGSITACFSSEERPANDECEDFFNSLMTHEDLRNIASEHSDTKWYSLLVEVLSNPGKYLAKEANTYTLLGLSTQTVADQAELDRGVWLSKELSLIVGNFPSDATDAFHFVSYGDPGLLETLCNTLGLIEKGYAKIDIDIICADEARFTTFRTLVSKVATEMRVEIAITNYASVEAHREGAAQGVHLIYALDLTNLQSHHQNLLNLKTKLHDNGGLLVGSEKLTAVFLREGMKYKMPAAVSDVTRA